MRTRTSSKTAIFGRLIGMIGRRAMRAAWRLRSRAEGGAELSFPNQNRFYDATRRAVRFWGYDSVIESSFFVPEESLKKLQPNMRLNESGLLAAFDLHRERILAAAAKIYARGRKLFWAKDRGVRIGDGLEEREAGGDGTHTGEVGREGCGR